MTGLMLQMWHGVLFHDLPRAGILRNCFSSQKTVFFGFPHVGGFLILLVYIYIYFQVVCFS